MQDIFPEFIYESNKAWGFINSMESLAEICSLVIRYYDDISNVKEFLLVSKKSIRGPLSFGRRREHKSKISLYDFLEEHKLLDPFLEKMKLRNPSIL